MNILFLISEVEDIIKTGGLADVGKALPLALKALGHDVKIMLPYYKQISASVPLSDAMPKQDLTIHSQHYSFGVKQLSLHGLDVYLIDHPYFSNNESPYSEEGSANAQRFAFFSIAALKVANDVCALSNVPLLDAESHAQVYTDNGYLNLLKTGIAYADTVCPVSPTYAQEVKTVVGSHGIYDVINQKPDRVIGVLNGCDYTQWNPSTDTFIPASFSLDDISGKAVCKAELQKRAKLKALKQTPLIGMVCRATEQKGFGYILPILKTLFEHKVQLVIVGTGDAKITSELASIAKQHKGQFTFIEAFSPELAHLIEAGSDFFLMPSEFEPCGLNQMYSLAYGTLPIVRSVGGLADTVIDASNKNGTGFVFDEPSSIALLSCLRRVLLLNKEQPKLLKDMQKRAMATEFTWANAALEYQKAYTKSVK